MIQRKRFAAALIATAACGALVGSASAAQLIYEPFDYADGTAVSATGPWAQTGPAGSPVHTIVNPGTEISPAGFPAATGGMANMVNTDFSELDRISIPDAFNPDTTPKYSLGSTLYYSLLLQIPSTDGLNQQHSNANVNDGLIIGFNNQQGTQGTRAGTWAGELTIRLGSTAGTYNLGVRSSNTPSGTKVGHTYWTGDITAGTDTHLIVVSFSEGNGTLGDPSNGTNSLWVDPNSTTYGDLAAPTADGSSEGVIGNSGSDVFGVESVVIADGINDSATDQNPNNEYLDEIRVGTTWRDVTSIPEPASLSLLALGGIGLLSRRRRRA